MAGLQIDGPLLNADPKDIEDINENAVASLDIFSPPSTLHGICGSVLDDIDPCPSPEAWGKHISKRPLNLFRLSSPDSLRLGRFLVLCLVRLTQCPTCGCRQTPIDPQPWWHHGKGMLWTGGLPHGAMHSILCCMS